jgi:hypothetical protein
MTESIPFPHPALTPITGKPTAATIKQLKKETFANARSVHSELGGGMNGHLGDVMAVAPYVVLRAGQSLVLATIHPGVQDAHPVNAMQAQITAANRLYDKAKDDYTAYSKVHESLKQQILTAANPIYYQDLEDDTFGYTNATIPAILEHLTTTYGQLTAANLENYRAKLTEQWNPDDPLENLWKRICAIRGDGITNGATIELTLEALQKAGVYDHATTTWYDKDEADHTWPNFMLHFTKHEKERHRKMTARAAGFHGANQITPEPKTAPKENPDGNTYGSKEDPSAFKSNNIELYYYCWTHGLLRNLGHTSCKCEHKVDNHQDNATLDNRMGGVNKILFGRSGNFQIGRLLTSQQPVYLQNDMTYVDHSGNTVRREPARISVSSHKKIGKKNRKAPNGHVDV